MFHQSHIQWLRLLKNDVNELIITHTLREFSLGAILVFVPIFLLTKGFSFPSVILFLLGQHGITPLYKGYLLNLAGKMGLKKSIMISFPFSLLFFVALYNLETLVSVINPPLAAFLLGTFFSIGNTFYWMAYHLDFTRNYDDKKEGVQISYLNIFPILLGILSPFIGGSLSSYLSFEFTFLIVMGLLIIAGTPLFMTKETYITPNFSWKTAMDMKNMRKNALFFIEGFYGIGMGLCWPLLLYLLKLSLVIIGGIISLTNLFRAVSTYISGKLSDKKDSVKILEYSSFTSGTVTAIRPFLMSTPIGFTGIHLVGEFVGPFFNIPLMYYLYRNAKKNPVNGIANREIYLDLGRTCMILLLLIFVIFLAPIVAFLIGLILAGLTMSSILLIIRNDRIYRPEDD